MPSQDGWRANQRESDRVQNGRPMNEGRATNGNRISVAKHQSGKKCVYMMFLHDRGRKQFRDIHKENFDERRSDHKNKMTELYRALDPRKRAEYQAQADAHNSNKQLVKKWKEEQWKRVRELRHNNPELYLYRWKEHREYLEQENSQKSIANPRKHKEIFFEEDLNTFCEEQKNRAKTTLESTLRLYQGREGNPIVMKDFKFLVVSVFPITFSLKTDLNQVCCYPAEISVTVFDLVDGIVENSSKLVQFDYNWCFGENPTSADKDTLSFYSSMIGVNKYGHEQGEYPHDVFIWLERILARNACAKVLCDRNQFNYVYYGIRNLAAYTGTNARQTFNRIADALVSIQDYTSIILDSPMRTAPRRWTDDEIKNMFLYHSLVPNSDKNLFCEFHDRAPAPHKYYCVKAHNARLIHNFFRTMRAQKLHRFDFKPPVHEPCIVDETDPNLPKVFSQPAIKRSDYPNLNTRGGNMNSEPIYHPDLTNDPNEDDENDDDDEDEDLHDSYYDNHQQRYHQPQPRFSTDVFNSSLHRTEERMDNDSRGRMYDDPQPRQSELSHGYTERLSPPRANPRRVEQPQPVMTFFFGIPDSGEYEVPVLQRITEQESERCFRIASKVGKKLFNEIDLPI